jgi:hypothetical protein
VGVSEPRSVVVVVRVDVLAVQAARQVDVLHELVARVNLGLLASVGTDPRASSDPAMRPCRRHHASGPQTRQHHDRRRNSRIKILDFGLAKLHEPTSAPLGVARGDLPTDGAPSVQVSRLPTGPVPT